MNQLLAHLLNSFFNRKGINEGTSLHRDVYAGPSKWWALGAIALVPAATVVAVLLLAH